MKFIQKIEKFNIAEVENISTSFHVPNLIAKILVSRGINTTEKANIFFNSTINDLNNPYLFNNMEKVVQRITNAIKNKEKIVLFGDYDVDGISATAILYKFLIKQDARVQYFLPSRYLEGYGLSEQTVERVFELHNPNLIITVDCGITAVNEIELIKQKGCDVIVTDHHEPQSTLPNCLIVDAKVEGEKYPFKELCGTGVAFKVVQAFVDKEQLKEYLPICAIATASDVVELVDENRIIVKEGFKLFPEHLPLGLREFLHNLRLETNISAIDFIFKITPKLNAAGRLGDAYEALKLFISNDEVKIHKAIKNLIDMNEKRKTLCDKAMQECEEIISKDKCFKQNKAIILKSENWDSGMLGIVCARLLEEYGKPVILFSNEEDKLVGSMRSVKGVDVVEVFNNVKSCLEKYGGHSMAGGVTLLPENYEIFKEQVEKYLQNNYKEENYVNEKYYDAEIFDEELTLDMAHEINKLAPFGYCNEKPVFKINMENARAFAMAKYPQHLIVKYGINGNFVFFDGGKYKEHFLNFKNIEALIMLDENNYNSTKTLKGIIKDINFKNIKKINQNFMQAYQIFNFVKYQNYDEIGNIEQINYENINELLKNKLGTLFVTYSNAKINNLSESYGNVFSKRTDNQLIYGLSDIDDVKYFDNVVFLDGVLNLNTPNYLSKKYNCKIYYKSIAKSVDLRSLKITRENLIEMFVVFKQVVLEEKMFCRDEELYLYLQSKFNNFKKYTLLEFLIALYAFLEINVLEKKFLNNLFCLKSGKIEKTELSNSKIYSNFLILKGE